MDTSITKIEPIYALYPQHILSKNDDDEHFIDEHTLCMLYGVRIEHCLVVRLEDFTRPDKRELIQRASKLIPLKPSYSGKYQIPANQPSGDRPISDREWARQDAGMREGSTVRVRGVGEL